MGYSNQEGETGPVSDILNLKILFVNVCLIGQPGKGNDWVLVDAGLANGADDIVRTAAERFGASSRPMAIVLTHGHFDHVGSIFELVEKWDVPVYAHELEIPYLTGQADYPPPDPTVGGGLMAFISPAYPNKSINLGNRLKKLPKDGSIPCLPNWQWIHTPGHTPGHVSFFRGSDRVLISGDAFITVNQESALDVLTQKQEVNGPPTYFTTDWKAAYESVKKLKGLRPAYAFTGHGLPMWGDALSHGLEELATHFNQVAVPEKGRYVNK